LLKPAIGGGLLFLRPLANELVDFFEHPLILAQSASTETNKDV